MPITTIESGSTKAITMRKVTTPGSSKFACFGQRAHNLSYHGHSDIANTTPQPSAGKKPRSVHKAAPTSTTTATSAARR